MPDTADQAVTDIPCATHPALFSAPDQEKTKHREAREKQAVNLCRTGGPYGTPCPIFDWCDATTDDADKWTVRAGRTPEDRGYQRETPDTLTRPQRTWDDCGSHVALNRHYTAQQTACHTCLGFRRDKARAAREAREQHAEVAA